jgi:hypothetical protein
VVGNFGIQNQFTGAHLGEQAFASVGKLFQFGEAEEAATALDGVNGAKNAAEQFAVAGVRLKVDEFLIETTRFSVLSCKKSLTSSSMTQAHPYGHTEGHAIWKP